MKLPAYSRTKPSLPAEASAKGGGVAWLGDVPEHWEVKRLKYSASINDEALPETTLPTFESDRERNQFVVTMLFHHFLSPEDWAWLRQFQEIELSDEEAKALVFVRELGAIHNAAYRSINHVDVLAASQHLRRLRNHGLLQQKGKGADTYYEPTDKLLAPWQTRGGEPAASASPVSPPTKRPGQSIQAEAQSIQPAPQPIQLSDLPEPLAIQVRSLGGRPKKRDAIRSVILGLCAWRPLSADELATLLGRTRIHLVNEHLSPMLADGVLTHTIPEQPRHPQQKYRATPPQESQP